MFKQRISQVLAEQRKANQQPTCTIMSYSNTVIAKQCEFWSNLLMYKQALKQKAFRSNVQQEQRETHTLASPILARDTKSTTPLVQIQVQNHKGQLSYWVAKGPKLKGSMHNTTCTPHQDG